MLEGPCFCCCFLMSLLMAMWPLPHFSCDQWQLAWVCHHMSYWLLIYPYIYGNSQRFPSSCGYLFPQRTHSPPTDFSTDFEDSVGLKKKNQKVKKPPKPYLLVPFSMDIARIYTGSFPPPSLLLGQGGCDLAEATPGYITSAVKDWLIVGRGERGEGRKQKQDWSYDWEVSLLKYEWLNTMGTF